MVALRSAAIFVSITVAGRSLSLLMRCCSIQSARLASRIASRACVDAEQFAAVDAAELFLNFFPLVAGRALVDARDISALIDHGETFPKRAVPPVDGLGERCRTMRGLDFLPADMHKDQASILKGLRELIRRLGELPCEADFAGGLAERFDFGLRRALRVV